MQRRDHVLVLDSRLVGGMEKPHHGKQQQQHLEYACQPLGAPSGCSSHSEGQLLSRRRNFAVLGTGSHPAKGRGEDAEADVVWRAARTMLPETDPRALELFEWSEQNPARKAQLLQWRAEPLTRRWSVEFTNMFLDVIESNKDDSTLDMLEHFMLPERFPGEEELTHVLLMVLTRQIPSPTSSRAATVLARMLELYGPQPLARWWAFDAAGNNNGGSGSGGIAGGGSQLSSGDLSGVSGPWHFRLAQSSLGGTFWRTLETAAALATRPDAEMALRGLVCLKFFVDLLEEDLVGCEGRAGESMLYARVREANGTELNKYSWIADMFLPAFQGRSADMRFAELSCRFFRMLCLVSHGTALDFSALVNTLADAVSNKLQPREMLMFYATLDSPSLSFAVLLRTLATDFFVKAGLPIPPSSPAEASFGATSELALNALHVWTRKAGPKKMRAELLELFVRAYVNVRAVGRRNGAVLWCGWVAEADSGAELALWDAALLVVRARAAEKGGEENAQAYARLAAFIEAVRAEVAAYIAREFPPASPQSAIAAQAIYID